MLKTTDMALRHDFQLGELWVSPSRRTIRGPSGEAHLEPRIMQVFLLLLDADGRVVPRSQLFDQCWGGAIVGDDSLNQAIGKVRRVGAEVAPGLFEVETIPRTGYRLTGKILGYLNETLEDAGERPAVSRRLLISAGAAATAVLGAGIWWVARDRTDPQFDAVMARGEKILLGGAPYDPSATSLYENAVRLEPGSAKAWGLLAYFTSDQLEGSEPGESQRIIAKAEGAIQRALAIDPNEPNALTAMYLLKGPMLDWVARDRQLRDILKIDPDNIPAMTPLMGLLQAAGLTRESWKLNERLLEIAPFSRNHLVFRAMKLWILGRVADSDRVIDRVRDLWPRYEFAFGIRLMLFALTGRPKAALAMLDSVPGQNRPPVNIALWRPALAALDSGSPEAIDAARIACLEGARKTPRTVNIGVMILGALGLVDEAFEIANGYLLWRGKVISGHQTQDQVTNDFNRRMPPWLFTPPLAIMRDDPRFMRLCQDLGLTDYWNARRVRPDYMRA